MTKGCLKQFLIKNNTKQEDEKYSYDNLFKHETNDNRKVTNGEESVQETTSIVEHKESLWKRIFHKIKHMLHFDKKI